MRKRLLATALIVGTWTAGCEPGTPDTRGPEDDGADDSMMASEALLARRVGSGQWVVADTPSRAVITGGPWTLGQGPTTQTNPTADFPNPNPGTNNFAPYFWPMTMGDEGHMLGLFDYRPRKLREAVVAARSGDGGRSWDFVQLALDYNPNPVPDPIGGNENGQGHPFALRAQGRTLLYTLDRTPGVQDVGGLIVHRLRPTLREPMRGAPASEMPLSVATLRTEGLLNPDGIIAQVPGMAVPMIVYLQRVLGPSGPLSDVTTARLAVSADGISWRDLGPLSGLQDDGTTFIGARGSMLRNEEGRFQLFFSGGITADNASDAYHYIGYAESTDLLHWQVVRGLANPLMSVETTEASGVPQSWWLGRVFGPAVTASHEGRSATMVFAGFHTANASNDFSDYRQIGRVTLELR
jgi:hypothetical protein